MSVLLEFSISPLDKGTSLSPYVSRSLEIIDRSGLPYCLNPMGTVIEGEWDECLAVVSGCFKAMAADCERVSCSIKIDFRQGQSGRLVSKIASIEKQLGRKLKT
jgi:uncharacterized protein (TIGR00106 family)